MSARWAACMVLVATWLAAPGVPAQEPGEAEYRPLFTEDMIQRASPEQADRMRATEQRNRQAFEQRQRASREQQEAEARKAAAPPPPPPPRKSKIYRWVDENGRVHFGDAPGGRDAEEIHVKGAARVKGTPPPPPGLGSGGEQPPGKD